MAEFLLQQLLQLVKDYKDYKSINIKKLTWLQFITRIDR